MENIESKVVERLTAAAAKSNAEIAAQRQRAVKGGHLTPKLLEAVTAAGLTSEDLTSFTKVTGPNGKLRVLIAKKGGRVDLSGFSVDKTAVIQVTTEDAKARHLGKVQGQLNFDSTDDEVLEAFTAALEVLKTTPAEEPKPARKPKAESTNESAPAETATDAAPQAEAAPATTTEQSA